VHSIQLFKTKTIKKCQFLNGHQACLRRALRGSPFPPGSAGGLEGGAPEKVHTFDVSERQLRIPRPVPLFEW
jgi:hypothetical protein